MKTGGPAACASIAVALLVLNGCSSPVPMEVAAEGISVDCARVIVVLPDKVGDFDKRSTNAQGTGAWGNPASALLTCGVAQPGPSGLECRTFDDVDWLIDDSDENFVRATTYGRSPTIEVAIDMAASAPGVILDDLADAVKRIPATSSCNV